MTAEADRLIGYMPIVIRASGLAPWERKFCATIISRTRRGAFTPSPKQLAVMARIVDGFLSRAMDEVTE